MLLFGFFVCHGILDDVTKPFTTLRVSGLSSTTTESDLMKVFDGCVEARIVFDESDKSMG